MIKNRNTKKQIVSERIISLPVTIFAMLSIFSTHAQQSYTFTTAGATGNMGPTQSQINTAYASTNLNGSVSIITQGIQEFTIPAGGAYAIEAFGAQGFGLSGVGGRGARMKGEFNFTAGQVIKILVGQMGILPSNVSYNAQYGGGGGTFVTDLANVPLVVAGGGGANWGSAFSAVSDAPTTTSGHSGGGASCTIGTGGSNGGGGGSASSADGGGGLTGDGTGTAGGNAFINGGKGGTSYGTGGFGGGGGTSSYNNRRCGGGGGYSGGGAANGVTSYFPEGGGGGSYNAGTNQSNTAGVNVGDGMVILTKLCNVNLAATMNPICYGEQVTLSTNALQPISWNNGSSASSIVVSPTATTVYTVSGTGAGTVVCVGTAVIEVSVIPLPDISIMVKPAVLCVGNAASLTVSGANSYTWDTGASASSITVNPLVTNAYTVSGTSISGCINTKTVNVVVNTNTLSVSPATTICRGEDVLISAGGAVTYTWNTGSLFQSVPVAPITNTVYSVTGTDIYNCQLSNSVAVTVNALPNVTALANKNTFCKGETASLTASGADIYEWSNFITGHATGATLNPLLSVDVPYTFTVIGTDNNGCSNFAFVTVIVSRCSGIEEESKDGQVIAYPNPNNGVFTISSAAGGMMQLSDHTGRIVMSKVIDGENTRVDISNLVNGIYYLSIRSGNELRITKLVKHK